MKSFHSWNRRDFIAKPAAWLAASRLFSSCDFLFGQSAKAAPKAEAGSKIMYRALGKTGVSLPIVSMGVMSASIPGIVKRAYELGVRHFDTAAGYQQGRNEEMLGAVIKEIGVRKDVTIATKAFIEPPMRRTAEGKDQLRKIFEGSLKRLQMDHVEILYHHAVDSAEDARLEGPIETLQALKKEGKIRYTGISTHASEAILNTAIDLGVYDVVLITINYTMAGDKGLLDAIERAAKKGIGLIAMKTQAGGTTKPDPKLKNPLVPESQTALLKWVMRNESITTAIPGVTTYEQLEQDFAVASNLNYSPAERDFLSDKNAVVEAEFCKQCGQCRPDCPLQVDIPALMRSHMYAVQYSNRELADTMLASVAAGRGLDACGQCESCSALCHGSSVNIARKVSDLKEIVLRA